MVSCSFAAYGTASWSCQLKFGEALQTWQVPSVEIMYLHAPDHKTPLTETLAAMDELHKEGKFTQLGLSNYSAWLVNEVHTLVETFLILIMIWSTRW